jgi:Flp pilus assembly protein TadG
MRMTQFIDSSGNRRGAMKYVEQFAEDSGQTLVVVALCMGVIMGFLGLAIDVGRLRYDQRNLQTAADAAAVAAGLEIRICGNKPNCAAMQAAATAALNENGFTGSTLLTNCASSTSTDLTLTVNSPACALGSNDPNTGKNNYVEVVVAKTERTYFARVLGFDNVKINARAESERAVGGPCIYALDPSGSSAITIDVGLVSTCSMVDESSSSSALTCLLSATVSVPRIKVTGGDAGLLCAILPAPTLRATTPTPADPLAYLPTPSMGACGTSVASPYHGSSSVISITALNGAVTFYPGTYCGGININLLANATFQPGMYIIKSNHTGLLGSTVGGLSINLLSTVTGTGVTFYNDGPSGSISFLAPSVLGLLGSVSLTAPTSGEYGGMLFMQDPGNTTPSTIIASGPWGTKLQGAFYFPNATVNYAVDGVASYNILVAKDIVFLAVLGSSFGNDYTSLDAGSPLGGDSAVLVQ